MQGELRQVADLALFAKIVQTGGISRCALDLGLERTTVSRRLGSLERELGVKLLDRTPKHIAVTEAGRRCLEQCEQVLESASNAFSLATIGSVVANKAPIVVGAPPDIIERFLDEKLREFEAENPGLSIERRPITTWTDDAIEAVDVGIALAPVAVNAAWTNAIGHVRQSVFASTEYAAQHAAILSPFDLDAHDCIIESAAGERQTWRFESNERVTSITVTAKYVVANLLEAREAALAGLGIARLPHYLCEPYIRSGRVVDLMLDTNSAGREVIILSPRQIRRKTGTAALRMHLESAFGRNAR
jgi:DNA-binding transcriptional LysR family regulator